MLVIKDYEDTKDTANYMAYNKDKEYSDNDEFL